MGGTGWVVRQFSWDNKYAGLQVLLAKVLMKGGTEAYNAILKQYQAKAEFFLCACLQKNNGYNVAMTPGGLLFVDGWNNMQYVSSSSFLLAVYADYLSMAHATLNCPGHQFQPSELLKFARSQADYILGKNPKSMSYMVGYGASYPAHIHHRGASIVSKSIEPSAVGCIEGFEKWYSSKASNPNVAAGAVVGGPDQNDEFHDERSDYEHTEPSIAGNAPLVGLFARLSSISEDSGSLPGNSVGTHPASPDVPVKFLHSITKTWVTKGVDYYRHKVNVKNASGKKITELKLVIENLSGPLWGLSPTMEKNVYNLPPWLEVLNPGSQFDFVYVQGGPQAKVSVLGYH